MKLDSLRQSVKGPTAAGFVPKTFKICTTHLFVLGTKLDKAYNAHSVSQHPQ